VKNIINSQNYVAEYKLNNYPIGEADILAKGRDAWETYVYSMKETYEMTP
jgi:acyl-CoA dehydrogenase